MELDARKLSLLVLCIITGLVVGVGTISSIYQDSIRATEYKINHNITLYPYNYVELPACELDFKSVTTIYDTTYNFTFSDAHYNYSAKGTDIVNYSIGIVEFDNIMYENDTADITTECIIYNPNYSPALRTFFAILPMLIALLILGLPIAYLYYLKTFR